jgi:hypothetical protein
MKTDERDGGARAVGPAAVFDVDAHRRALLLRRRCGTCAECVGPAVLLRGEPCPHCGSVARWPSTASESLLDALAARWRRRRWVVYGLLALSTGLTGFLPVIPTLVAAVFMIALRHTLMREPLKWFGPPRRLVTGINLKLWLVSVAALTLVATTLLSLVPFANVPLNAVACLATTALFVEVSLVYLRDRLRREATGGAGLDAWEWGVPALLAGLALVTTAMGVAAVAATLSVLESILA